MAASTNTDIGFCPEGSSNDTPAAITSIRFCSIIGQAPSSSEWLGAWTADQVTTFAAGLPTAVGTVVTPPTSEYTLILYAHGGSVGNITISTAGVVAFHMVDALVLQPGEALAIYAQSTVDANIFGISLNIPGSL